MYLISSTPHDDYRLYSSGYEGHFTKLYFWQLFVIFYCMASLCMDDVNRKLFRTLSRLSLIRV